MEPNIYIPRDIHTKYVQIIIWFNIFISSLTTHILDNMLTYYPHEFIHILLNYFISSNKLLPGIYTSSYIYFSKCSAGMT